jgi:hypothetical protein
MEKAWRKQVLRQTGHIYWHLGLKPHWVTIYKTHSKILAFGYTRPYIAANFPVRVVRLQQEYHVQIYDQKNPIVTHTFYPQDVHKHRLLRKRLDDFMGRMDK